jgi:hypothetical protein
MRIKSGILPLLLLACLAVTTGLSALAGPALATPRPLRMAGQPSANSAGCPKAKAKGSSVPASDTEPARPVFAAAPVRAQPQSAGEFARDVLAEAVIPPGSVRATISSRSILATPVANPAIKGLTDIYSAYKIPLSVSAAEAYEKAHLPRGARLAGSGGDCDHGVRSLTVLLTVSVAGSHEYSAGLAIGLVSLGRRSSLLRVDAQVMWVASRPAAEKAQASADLELTIYGPQSVGNMTITLSGAQEREVTRFLNSLPIGAAADCAESDPLYRLQYVSAAGSPEFLATGYGCAGTILVDVDGKTAAPLHDGNLGLVRLIDSFRPDGLKIFEDASSGGWAGWVDTLPPGSYQSSSATWTVPKVSCDPLENSAAVEWVGLDGFGESTVEQTGTQTFCEFGQDSYGAWWELFGTPVNGGALVNLPGNDHVHPGDQIFDQVVAGQGSPVAGPPGGPGFPGAGQYLFYMVNFTERWSFWVIEPPSALNPSPPDQTVEWIVEQPSCFWTCQALAQYGQVTFTGMDLTLNTFAYPFGPVFPPGDPDSPGPFNGFSVNLVTGTTLKETGSSLAGGNREVVTFVHK